MSSDDFFYNLGYLFYAKAGQYGQTPIQDTAAQYGLGQLTGIDLPGEVQGRVDSQAERVKLHARTPKAFPNTTWYTGDNIEMAFGQGGTVHHARRAGGGLLDLRQRWHPVRPAGGGGRRRPHRAGWSRSSPPRSPVTWPSRPPTTRPCSPGFEGVVNNRERHRLRRLPGLATFPGGLAGKTGTADTEPGKEPTAWFVGLGPDGIGGTVRGGLRHRPGRVRGRRLGPVVGQIFNYLATHPVGPAVVPPVQKVYQATSGVALPTPTTTTTTAPAGGSTTSTSTRSGA